MDRFERGTQQLDKMKGNNVDLVFPSLKDVAPDLVRLTIEFAYGDVLGRPGLSLKSRQVATVAALTALGNAPLQLNAHINMALNVGCSRGRGRGDYHPGGGLCGIPCGIEQDGRCKRSVCGT